METSRRPRSARAVPLALGVLALVFALRPINDFDVWYHLAAARLIWRSGSWPTTNTFSYSAPDHPWIDLHWLFQLLLYAFHALGGANGCILLVAVLLLATVGVLYAFCRRFVAPAAAALLVAAAVTIASPRFVPRPEMASFLLLAIYVTVLDGYPRNGRWIYALVPLQIVWTNSQGIFAIGHALIACYWLGATLAFLPLPRGWREESGCTPREWRTLTAVLVLAGLGAFVNPYGVDGVLFPLQLLPSVTGSSIFTRRIGEFRGPFESGYAPALTYAWVALLVLTGLAFLVSVRRIHLGRLLAATAFGWLSAQTLRNMALFAWISAPVIAATLGPSARRFAAQSRSLRRLGTPPVRLAANVMAVAVLLTLGAAVVTNRFTAALGLEHVFGLGVSGLRFSSEAAAFARDVGIAGRPFNCLAIGGFLIWERPEDRVLVDGRLEAYPETVFRDYFQAVDDPNAFPQFAAKHRPDYAYFYHLWPNRLPLARFLAAGHGWTLVYYDFGTSIFLPDDDAHRELRERARQRFAEILARRRTQPPPPPRWWNAVVIPLEEYWEQHSYGDLLRALGQYDDAIAAYERALKVQPNDIDTRFALGLTYWSTNKRSLATAEWRTILRRDPSYERAKRALSNAADAATQ